MKYRICSMMLALLAASGACLSCGSETKTPAETDGTAPVTTAAETEAETLPPEYENPNADYGGETFTLAAIEYGDGNGAWMATDYCEVYEAEENGDVLNDAVYQRLHTVSDALNLTFDHIAFSTFANSPKEFRKFVMAGEDVIDLAMLGASFLPQVLGRGMLVDWNTIPNVDFTHSWWDPHAVRELTLSDSMYAVTGDISLYISFAPITYFFGKKIVTELGLDDPYALVDSGKWTIAKMIEMSRAAASDLNGDGAVDIGDRFGLLCEPGSQYHATMAAGCRLTKKNSDNLPEIAPDLERIADVMDQFCGFMADKTVNMLSSNYSKGYKNVYKELLCATFMDSRGLFFSNQLLVALNLRSMDADFGILPPPKLDETQENYCCPINDWWGTFAVIPTTNTKYEMTGHVAEALGYYGQQIVTPAYIDTTVRGKALRDDESSRMVELILANRVYDTATFYDWGGIKSMLSKIQDGKSFMSNYASVEKKAKTALSKTIAELEENTLS